MVNREQLREICDKYGLDSKKIIKNNENVIEKADYTSICYVLDYLKDTLKITSNNIEKCPSILYLNVGAIKENWRFLNEQKIHMNDVETCLHILSTEPKHLKETYKYVSDENRYGKKYIEQITSILSVPVERIQEIEERCPELTKNNVLSAAISRRTIQEIEEIIKVCKENGIEATGTVFMKSAQEIKEIIKVCKENGIEATGTVFLRSAKEIEEIIKVCKENGIEATGNVFKRTAKEIEKIIKVCKENGIEATGTVFQRTAKEVEEIIKVCKENGIEVTGSVFKRTAKEIEEIIKVCKENGIEVTGSVFMKSAKEVEEIIKVCKENGIEVTGTVFTKSAQEIEEIIKVCNENEIEITGSIFHKSSKQLKENIEFIKQNYGEEYLTPLIISKNLKNLQKILPYLQSIGVLETVKNSASILSLTLEEIQERQAFAEKIGEPIVKNGRFNLIFGLSRKNYQKKVKEFAEKQELIGEIKGAIQEGKILDEQISDRKKERNNGR